MCTTDCKCWSGINEEIKQKWVDYGNGQLMKYKRNTGDKNEFNNKGETTYPMKWTNDPAAAINTFK